MWNYCRFRAKKAGVLIDAITWIIRIVTAHRFRDIKCFPMLNPPRIPTGLRIVRTCVPGNSAAVMPNNISDRNICESEVGCKVDLSGVLTIAGLVQISHGMDDRQDSLSVSETSQENNDVILDLRVVQVSQQHILCSRSSLQNLEHWWREVKNPSGWIGYILGFGPPVVSQLFNKPPNLAFGHRTQANGLNVEPVHEASRTRRDASGYGYTAAFILLEFIRFPAHGILLSQSNQFPSGGVIRASP